MKTANSKQRNVREKIDDADIPKEALKMPGKSGSFVIQLSDKPKSNARSLSFKEQVKEKEEEELKKRELMIGRVLGG